MVMTHSHNFPTHGHLSLITYIWTFKNIITQVKRLFYPWDIPVGVTLSNPSSNIDNSYAPTIVSFI